jgi:3-deoxy-D-manno-octulosonate 8-phosphate phosphatase (KDO 8-P phosphatase)
VIRLIVLDVDGTLTNGGITYDANGVESKTFNVKDGFAIASWIRIGRQAAIITGRNSPIVAKRAAELGITHFYQGVKDKAAKLREILEQEGISMDEVAVAGDDLNDFRMMQAAGLSFAPADASPYMEEATDVKLSKRGGEGAVAEMVEYLVKRENLEKEYTEFWKK